MKQQEMKDVLTKNALDYAKYTITDRAIVNLSDGLKNIHRRIIWSMYLDGLTHNKNRTKSVNAVGSVLRFSPHGDSSVYSACVRLANDSVLYQLIDGKGSFSSITTRDIQAGASRYTEMRLSLITQELLKNIDKNVVDMINNYDDTRLEPTELPVSFPLVLANPNLGIAVGIASNICSFNLEDIIKNTINVLNGSETFMMIPDFPTGANILYNEKVLKDIKSKGTGTFYLRAKYHIEGNSIVVTEIPYTTTREAIIESVISLVKDNKIKEVVDINDYSGVKGLNITIDIKNNVNAELLMKKLFKMTPLQSSFSCNFTMLLDNKPVTLGTDNIIKEWIKFRIQCIKRATQFDIDKNSKKLHLLKGLEKVLLDLERAINIVKNTEEDSQVIPSLMSSFNIDQQQAEYVAEIKLRNFNKQYILNRTKEIESLISEIQHLNNTYNNESEIKQIIISQLQDVAKKYGKARKTEIIYDDITVDDKEVIVDDYNCKLILTKQSYLKKNLRYTESQKLKDGDSILQVIDSNNKDDIILLSNLGNCYKLKCHELNEHKPSQLGEYLPNLLNMEKNEQIIFTASTSTYSGYILSVFENGKVAKVNLNSYQTKTNRSKLANSLNVDSSVVRTLHIEKDIDLILVSDIEKVLVYNTSNINAKSSRNTQGNQVMKSKADSKVMTVKLPDEVDFEDITYYTSNNAAVGKYLKRNDKILF